MYNRQVHTLLIQTVFPQCHSNPTETNGTQGIIITIIRNLTVVYIGLPCIFFFSSCLEYQEYKYRIVKREARGDVWIYTCRCNAGTRRMNYLEALSSSVITESKFFEVFNL